MRAYVPSSARDDTFLRLSAPSDANEYVLADVILFDLSLLRSLVCVFVRSFVCSFMCFRSFFQSFRSVPSVRSEASFSLSAFPW